MPQTRTRLWAWPRALTPGAFPSAGGGLRSQRIDQLRGFAALAVVACHFAVSAAAVAWQPDAGWPAVLVSYLGFGYLGVPLFFVISGFCIHLPQARALTVTPAARPRWRHFFARRFWRLYPTYLAALLGALVLLWPVHGGPPASWPAIGTQAFLVQTFHGATFDGVNPPAWTLAVEAQLYLVYPVVFWLITRRGVLRALATILAITMAYRVTLTFHPVPEPFGGPAWEFFIARWFEWVLGAVVAEWVVGRIALPPVLCRPWLAAVALALAFQLEFQRWRVGAYTIMEPMYGIAFALVLCVALAHERDAGMSRSGRYLAEVGAYSYSLYLVHRPIQLAVQPLAGTVAGWPSVLDHRLAVGLLIMAATTPVVLLAARMLYRHCEAPCIERSRRVGSGPGPTRAEHADVRHG